MFGFWNLCVSETGEYLPTSSYGKGRKKETMCMLTSTIQVSAPTGIKTSTGLHIPYGTNLAVPMHSIHMDEDFYLNATHFDAFRFAPHGDINAKPLVTLDDTFLTFGFGRHGCPGRFFGVHLMKTMMAYVVQNYDVEGMKERPKIVELMEFRFPSEGTVVRVRRRKGRGRLALGKS